MNRKEKIRYWLYMAPTRLLALLPLRVLYILSDFLYFLFYKVFKYRLKVVRRNLSTTFPEKSEKELREIEREFYHQLADTVVETIKLLHISHKQLKRHVEVTNPELIEEMASRGEKIILYLAHYGNWEWVTALTLYFSDKLSSGFFAGHIYLEQHDKAADTLMWKVRSKVPSTGIEVKMAPREILRIAKEYPSMMVGFISDHRFNSVPRNQSMMFLNHNTSYYLGGEVLGGKIGAKFLYLDIEKPKRGHYRLTYREVIPTDSEPHAVTRRYMNMLEDNIRRRPGLWLWSHKRWPELFS